MVPHDDAPRPRIASGLFLSLSLVTQGHVFSGRSSGGLGQVLPLFPLVMEDPNTDNAIFDQSTS